MVNVERLRAALRMNNISIDVAAEAIGIDGATFYRRLARQGTKFTVEEVGKLADLLSLSGNDLQEIFFDRELA